MKKALTELTEKELLSLIGDDPSTIEVYSWPNDVMEFISVYNLKTGEERITTKLLFKLYRLWSQSPVKRGTFSRTLTDLFPSMQNGPNLTILLDKKALNLKEEAYKYVKQDNKTKHKGWMEHFELYLHEYCIKKGSLFIKDSVLYNLYDKWRKNKTSPLGKTQFNNFCKLYLNHKVIKNHCWFSVHESIKVHLTEDLINEMSKTGAKQKTKQKI